MKKLIKNSILLLIATISTFSACKNKHENPKSGNCYISVETSSHFKDSTTYDNNGRPLCNVHFNNTYTLDKVGAKMNFDYNSSNQIIKATSSRPGDNTIFLFNYDNQNKLNQRIRISNQYSDTTFYDYDLKTNKIIKERKRFGVYVRYEYDGSGNNILKVYRNSYSKKGFETLDVDNLKFDDKNNPFANNPIGYELAIYDDLSRYLNKNNVLDSKYYYSDGYSETIVAFEYNGSSLPTKAVNKLTNYYSNGKPDGEAIILNDKFNYICK